jgi:hypothetical protein
MQALIGRMAAQVARGISEHEAAELDLRCMAICRHRTSAS